MMINDIALHKENKIVFKWQLMLHPGFNWFLVYTPAPTPEITDQNNAHNKLLFCMWFSRDYHE